MEIKRFYYENLEFVSLKNHDNFVVILCNLGASIYSIEMDGKFMTLTPRDFNVYKDKRIYHGKTIGRVANRIKDGVFKIGNKSYKASINEKINCLHGGEEGFSNQFFDMEIFSSDDEAKVIFTYYSVDTEGGFPGNLEVKVVYTIFENENNVAIDYQARSDKDTLLGLTNHSYFSLGSRSLDELSLYINAGKFIHPDKDNLYAIEYCPVDKVMDFQTMKKVTQDIDADYLVNSKTYGYDHHFCFNEVDSNKPQIVLENEKYKLLIMTNFDGNQIYTDNYPDKIKYEGTDLARRRGIAIEPQDDILNRKILKANEDYVRFIKYVFNRK